MHCFVEFQIKNSKKFWTAWEKAQNQIPEDVHFIQRYSSKDEKICIALWQPQDLTALSRYLKEFFSTVSSYKIYEIDDYLVEGQPIEWVA